MKTVCIQQADDGTVSVGMLPEGGAPGDQSYLQPVESIDAAFEQARQMLGGGEDKSAEALFNSGFQKVQAQKGMM